MGDRSLALIWVIATDLWTASVRAFIGEMGCGAGFCAVGAPACVLRMLARRGVRPCVREVLALREMGGRK